MGYSLWGRKESDRTNHVLACVHVCMCVRAHTHAHTQVTIHRMRFNPWLEKKIPQAAEELSLHTTTSESRHYNEKYCMMQGRTNTAKK